MIDAKLVEEIVQQVLSRLMEDPRFVAAANGGYFSGTPQNQAAQVCDGTILQNQNLNLLNRIAPLLQNQNPNPGIPRPGKPVGIPLQQNQNLRLSAPWFNRIPQGQQVAAPTTKSSGSVTKHHGRVLSEWDILTVHRSGGRAIAVAKSVIVTPLAKDRARDLSVDIIVE